MGNTVVKTSRAKRSKKKIAADYNCSNSRLSITEDEIPNLDSLTVVKTLGKGSFGSVEWVIYNKQSYALKKMAKARFFRSCDHSKLAWNERNAMLACDSCFVLPLECCFQTDTELYMLTPLYSGGDLLKWIKKMHAKPISKFGQGPVSYLNVELYMAQMLLALDHLHSHRICHRDIKPENIFIAADGYLVLGDLGLAIEIDDTDPEHESRHWGQCGSYGYRSPECVRSEPCGYPADVYSLGMSMYFLAFGGVPWSETKRRLEKEALTGKDSLFFPENNKMPASLLKLLAKMLKVNPDKRITVKDAMKHEALDWINWDKLRMRKGHPVPFIPPSMPSRKSLLKTAKKERKTDEPIVLQKWKPLTRKQQQKFEGFDNIRLVLQERENSIQSNTQNGSDYSVVNTPADSPVPSQSPAATPPMPERRLGFARSPLTKRRSLILSEDVSASLQQIADGRAENNKVQVKTNRRFRSPMDVSEAQVENSEHYRNLDVRLPNII